MKIRLTNSPSIKEGTNNDVRDLEIPVRIEAVVRIGKRSSRNKIPLQIDDSF